MDPITITLMAASIGGGLLKTFGKKGPAQIDPKWLKQHFGAQAVTDEFMQLLNTVLNSPKGREAMTNAAEQGQQFERQVAQNSAAAGFGPAGGGESGASIFSNAAAGGAGASLQRGVESDFAEMTLPIAQQMVNQRMQAAVQGKLAEASQPSPWETFGDQLGNAAGTALAAGAGGGESTTATKPNLPGATITRPGMSAPSGLRGAGPAATYKLSGQVDVPRARLNPGSSFGGRFGRGFGRFGRRFGNLVLPGNPLGSGAN